MSELDVQPADPIDPKAQKQSEIAARQKELDAAQAELSARAADDSKPAPASIFDLDAGKALIPEAVSRRIAADAVRENYDQLDRFAAYRRLNINTAWAAAKAGDDVALQTLADDVAAFLESDV